MDFKNYLLAEREIPFEDAASFHNLLRRPPQPPDEAPTLSKEAKLGILKLMMAKHAQGEEAEALQAAVMTDPQVQQALDHQAAVAQAQHSTQQLIAMQQQMEGMQQGMQQLQQQTEQMGQQLQGAQQQNSQLQEQLQGEMQMRQQSNMQAMQAQDQAINTKALAQKQRMDLSALADQMSLQLKQVAATDPEQQQQQEQMAAQQQQAAEQEAVKAQMPAKQRKEVEEAEKAQQQAQVQGQQAEQAMQQPGAQGPMAAAMQQQAAAQQAPAAAPQPPQAPGPEAGGMVAQSAAGMSKVDLLRHKLKQASVKTAEVIHVNKGSTEHFQTAGRLGVNPFGGKQKFSELGKCAKCGAKVKHSELEKHTCGRMKLAMVPPPTSALKARMIEAGIGAGLGAATGLAYEAGRQRFSHQPPTAPSPAEIDLERKNRASQIKAKESPTLINRLAATKSQAQLDAEREMRTHPKKQLLRRALQGAVVGAAAAPSVMAAKRNLSPRIMGR